MCGVENLYLSHTPLIFNVLFTDPTNLNLKLEDIM